VTDGSCLRHFAGAPRGDQFDELGRGDVRRSQDGAVGTEREQRRNERVVAAEHREAGRQVGQERDDVGADSTGGVLDADHAG
jgi:hypothetical protein